MNMKTKYTFLTLLLLLALLFLPSRTVYAQGPGPGSGRVLFGTNIIIESSEPFEGDLVLFGGNVTIEKDAELHGDLVVIGGNILSRGSVSGDVVVVGGQIQLEAEAVVGGDVVLVGGQIQRQEGARIEGELFNNAVPQIDIPDGTVPPVTSPAPSLPTVVNVNFNPFFAFGRVLLSSFLMAILGMLAVLFFQERLDKVSHAAVSQPLMALGIGILSVLVGGALFLTVIPVVALVFAWLFGMVAMGREVGERLARALRVEWTAVLSAGLGTFLLMFMLGSVRMLAEFSWVIGCFTWIIPALIGLLAIGSVVVTRFGAQSVQGPLRSVYVPPAEGNGG
jgi:hypothetical protein